MSDGSGGLKAGSCLHTVVTGTGAPDCNRLDRAARFAQSLHIFNGKNIVGQI